MIHDILKFVLVILNDIANTNIKNFSSKVNQVRLSQK